MEQVIAYKSTDGKLFLNEKDCVSYENRLAQYPKKKVKEEKSNQIFSFEDSTNTDIVKYTESIWKKPGSQRIDNIYYIVGGKYKFTNSMDSTRNFNCQLMYGISLGSDYPRKIDIFNLARYFAKRIMSGDDFNDEYMSYSENYINSLLDFDKHKIKIEVVEPNKKWVIDNPSWHSGIIRPITFEIEKL